MSDIVQRLRESATQARALDRAALLHEAADEIERLRSYEKSDEKRGDSDASRVLLTGAEREAIRFFSLIDGPGNVPVANKRAATLRGLLERTK